MRGIFVEDYSLDKHLGKLAHAFHAIERDPENGPAHARTLTSMP
jgi:hypothetical protein